MQRSVSDAEYIRWLENDRHNKDTTIAALREEVERLSGSEESIHVSNDALRARVTELERELAESKRAHESTADIMDVFRSANIDNAADARQFIKELAALQGKRNTAYSYIEDVLIGSPYEWAGKRLLEMIGGKP